MKLAVWWTLRRCVWSISPLPSHLSDRDRRLADRAALVLDRHLLEIPIASYKLDPYATKGPRFSAENPKHQALLRTAIARTELVLRRHTMTGHLMNALLRDRDPETIAHSKRVAAEVEREAAEERTRRGSTTIPPPPPASGSKLQRGTP